MGGWTAAFNTLFGESLKTVEWDVDKTMFEWNPEKWREYVLTDLGIQLLKLGGAYVVVDSISNSDYISFNTRIPAFFYSALDQGGLDLLPLDDFQEKIEDIPAAKHWAVSLYSRKIPFDEHKVRQYEILCKTVEKFHLDLEDIKKKVFEISLKKDIRLQVVRCPSCAAHVNIDLKEDHFICKICHSFVVIYRD